jgi:integrase
MRILYDLCKTYNVDISKNDGIDSILSEVTELRQENRIIYHDVKKDLEEIKQAVVKKPKEKRGAKPLRDLSTKDIFFYMLSLSKNKGEKLICYSRFRIAIVIFWYTGLRVNEIRTFTRKDIETLRDDGLLQVYQPKVNKYKKIYFPPAGQYWPTPLV